MSFVQEILYSFGLFHETISIVYTIIFPYLLTKPINVHGSFSICVNWSQSLDPRRTYIHP